MPRQHTRTARLGLASPVGLATGLAAALGVALLVGCASPPPAADAEILDGTVAPAVVCVPGAASERPVAGRLPEGFDPVAVVRCDRVDEIELEGDTWAGIAHVRLDGDLAPLLAALARPDDAPPWNGACSADMRIAPDLWLIDAAGDAILARYPTDGCGKPKEGPVDSAVLTLTEVDRIESPVSLVESGEARAAGCETYWAAPPALASPLTFDSPVELHPGEPAPEPGVGIEFDDSLEHPDPDLSYPVQPFPPALPDRDEVDAMTACLYTPIPQKPESDPGSDGGYDPSGLPVVHALPINALAFDGAVHLDRELVANLIEAAAADTRADQDCATTASRVAVVTFDDVPVAVELDACERMTVGYIETRQAPPELREALAAVVASS